MKLSAGELSLSCDPRLLPCGKPVVCCVGRVRLEAFSDNSGKLQLSLQEIIDWLTAKDEELSEQLPIGGDVGSVQHQREFHQVVPHAHTPTHTRLAHRLLYIPFN